MMAGGGKKEGVHKGDRGIGRERERERERETGGERECKGDKVTEGRR